MRTTAAISASALAAFTLFQSCPAPPVVLAPLATFAIGAAGELVGVMIEAFTKRAEGGDALTRRQGPPPGVPQEEYDRCYEELLSSTVTVNGDGAIAQFDGVPPTCMTLATVLVGNPVDGPHPTPCGSACLIYNDLGVDNYNAIRDIFEANKTG